MKKTPMASSTYVSLFGKVNAGKSSVFNSILDQERAIVSSKPGTTTDPVMKAMELIGFGPIVLVDTAGFEDREKLGEKRIKKTMDILNRTDFALYIADINNFSKEDYKNKVKIFNDKNIDHLIVFTKTDIDNNNKEKLEKIYKDAIFINKNLKSDIDLLRRKLIEKLNKLDQKESSLIGSLIKKGGMVLLVTPIDSLAPKGRLILPQVQLIRDCLDNDIKCVVCKESELEETLKEIKNIDLVVTDSQVFSYVNEIVPASIDITSFSMLFANQKGNINDFILGVKSVESLEDEDKILMLEACTHNTNHEDIGRVKIPKLLKKYTNKNLNFEYCVGYDFPEDLSEYKLAVHCGGCMLNRKNVINRLNEFKKNDISVTNYGVLISYLNGILDRSGKIFKK